MLTKIKKPKFSTDEVMMKQWEVLQSKGKKKYVWIDGVVILGFGIPTFLVLIDLLIGDNVYPTIRELTREYFINIIIASLGSYFYKRSNWKFFEDWSLKKQKNENLDKKIDFCYYCGTDIENTNICPECGNELML